MELSIEHLADHKDVVPTVAAWVYAQWPHFNPGATLEDIVGKLTERTVRHRIPETFVALHEGKPVGTASLVSSDLPTPQHLSPWLASVYVVPEYRNRGIGSRLVERVAAEAITLRIGKLYLYTPDKVPFYTRLGWSALRHTEHFGIDVAVMVRQIS